MKRPKDLEGFVLFSNDVYFQAVCTQGIMLPFLLPLPAGYQEHQTSVGCWGWVQSLWERQAHVPSEVVAGGSSLFLGQFNPVRVVQQVKLLEGLS